MQLLQSLASSITVCCILLVVVAVLPIVSSSQEHVKPTGNHSLSSVHNHHKQLSQKLLFEIRVHGFLLWASIGFLMPVGILAIRMSHREECGRRLKILFYVHSISQAAISLWIAYSLVVRSKSFLVVSVLLSTAGAVMSFKNFSNTFNNDHQRLGLSLYGIIWLQALLGFIRPSRGSKGRSFWFCVHWMSGTTLCILGIINMYTGLLAYHQKTSRSIRVWIIALTVEVCVLAFLYLLQDKWVYIKRQRVILGNDLVRPMEKVVISPEGDPKTRSFSKAQESI
ncbi:Cytochrome b561 domain-containing protein At2g30890 [Linum perenne]